MSEQSTMTSNRPYLLRAIYDWISDNDLTPYILVDATKPGVRVPAHTIRDGRVVLNLAMRAVANLELGNERIRCSARFGGISHALEVPVEAVLAIYAHENGQGMLLPLEDAADVSASGDSGAAPQQNIEAQTNASANQSNEPQSSADKP
ncbi:MAG: ClpXP protease specificity-enhancing factor, partial [Rhodanobacteraceae bacterium]